MKEKNNSKLFIFGLIATILAIIFATIYLSKDCHFLGDDTTHSTYQIGEKLFECLNFNFGSGYEGGNIGYFLSKFFSFKIPLFLNIHPQDFMFWGHGFIKGIFISLTLISICISTQLYKKSNFLLITSLICSFLFFIYGTYHSYSTIMTSYYLFYRYFFPLLFLGIFINYLYKNIFFKKKKVDKKQIIIASICIYLLSGTFELLIYTSIMLCSLLIIYDITVNLFYAKTKDRNIIKSYKIYLDKNFFIPFSCLFIAPIFFKTGFRGTNDPVRNISLAYDLSLDSLKEFIYYYLHILFKLEFLLWIIIIILFTLSVYFAFKKKEIKKIILPTFMLITILTVYLALFLCGKNCPIPSIPECKFYIGHVNIRFFFKMIILFPTFIYLSYVLQNLNKSIISKKIIKLSILFIIILLSIKNYISITDPQKNHLSYMKKANYISEKLMRFYQLKEETAYVPIINLGFTLHIFGHFDNNKCSYISEYKSYYYDTVYKIDSDTKTHIACRDENAIQKFYKNGGIFTLEELENIKYERLYNKDFVTNKLYEDFLFTRRNNYFIIFRNGISFSSINFNNNLL